MEYESLEYLLDFVFYKRVNGFVDFADDYNDNFRNNEIKKLFNDRLKSYRNHYEKVDQINERFLSSNTNLPIIKWSPT